MSFGRTPQLADNSYRNLTVSETLAVRGHLTAGTLDTADLLTDAATVNGHLLVGGTGSFLAGVITPVVQQTSTAGQLLVPDATGSLVVVDEDLDSILVDSPLTVTPGLVACTHTAQININGVTYNVLLNQ